MKKFKITFALVQPLTGKKYYQIIRAFNVKQTDDHNLNLLFETLVVGNLYYSNGIVSVEQIPNLDISL